MVDHTEDRPAKGDSKKDDAEKGTWERHTTREKGAQERLENYYHAKKGGVQDQSRRWDCEEEDDDEEDDDDDEEEEEEDEDEEEEELEDDELELEEDDEEGDI